MSNTIPKMITLLEASELTGLSYDFLRKHCLDGTLVHIRTGRKFLLNADKLAEYLNASGRTDANADSSRNPCGNNCPSCKLQCVFGPSRESVEGGAIDG